MTVTDNLDEPLKTVAELRRAMPLSEADAARVRDSRRRVRAIFTGEDDRILVVAGPCSVHDPEAVMEVSDRLAQIGDRHVGEVVLLMRAYFEKPRTHIGWKGFLSDPHLDGSDDLAAGLAGARRLLLALCRRGLGTASEMLDPHAAGYFSDLLSRAAIGARTSESQPHRELASGLPFPIGFKNGTDGRFDGALWAVRAAAAAHRHLAIGNDGQPVARRTTGNPHGHVVLRGGHDGPNHSADHIASLLAAQASRGVACPIVVDCSHGNSGKRHERQPAVARDVAAQIGNGQRALVGVMLESHLVAGRQDLVPGKPLVYGQSITDACIDMTATADCIAELADAVRRRRARRARPTAPAAACPA